MDNFLKDIMIREVGNHCDFAIKSFTRIQLINENRNERYNSTKDDVDYIWLYISSFLTSTANISKLLWGSYNNENTMNEREPIRHILNIDDNMKIKSKSFRNNFEHIDDEIIKWFKRDTRVFVDRNMIHAPISDDLIEPDFFRQFNSYLYIVYFLGEKYDLKEIVKEIESIQKSIDNYDRNKRR